MELSGEVQVAAARDRVWAALNDAGVLRRCIPGCEAMEASGEHERTATVALKVGPVRARFNGRVRMDDIRAGEGCTLHFEGQGGAAGMARGSSRVELLDEAGATLIRYQTQASVAGKLGQVGGRMIDAAARQMADQFFSALQAELAPARPAAAPEDSAEGTPPVVTTAATPAASRTASPAPTDARASAPSGDVQRVLWFVLGALSTGFGVWLGRALFG